VTFMHEGISRGAIALSLILGSAAAAAAQPSASLNSQERYGDLTLEQLMRIEVPKVEGASRFVQDAVDAPASITIVSADEIERFGYQTLADVLGRVRGFYLTSDRNYTYAGTRGLARPGDYNTRILLLVNGQRLNDNIFDSALLGTEFPVDIELVDRVEIVHGPSSSLYGANAFFAVVNVVTKRAASSEGVDAGVRFGSLGRRAIRAGAAKVFAGGAEAVVSASTYGSDGLPSAEAEDRRMDRDGSRRVFGSLRFGSWTAQGGVGRREKGIPTGAFGVSLDDPRSQTTDTMAFAMVSFDRRLRGTAVSARAQYDWYAYDGVYAVSGEPLLLEEARGTAVGLDGAATRTWRGHRITGGVEARHNPRQDQRSWDLGEPLTVYLDDRHRSTNWAAYVQDEWHVTPTLLLNAGLRRDAYSLWEGATSPRVALIYKPSGTSSIKLLHGRAFRTPTLYESFYYSETPVLKPERITTNELVGEAYAFKSLRLTASGFVYRVTDLISQSEDELTALGLGFANAQTVRAAGFELDVERAWKGGWTTGGNVTLQRALDGPDDAVLSNSPARLVRLRAAGEPVRRRLTAAFEVAHVSSRTTPRGTAMPGTTVARVALGGTPIPGGRMKWHLSVENALDEPFFDPATLEHPTDVIRQEGRTISVGATWRF
jgi:outer membrane receptor for ferrienterochelin and colicins